MSAIDMGQSLDVRERAVLHEVQLFDIRFADVDGDHPPAVRQIPAEPMWIPKAVSPDLFSDRRISAVRKGIVGRDAVLAVRPVVPGGIDAQNCGEKGPRVAG